MRQQMGEQLQAWYDHQAESELRDNLMRMASETFEFTPTDAAIEKAVDSQIDSMRSQLAQNGLTLEMYYQFTNSTEEQVREDVKAEAINGLRMLAAADKIAELENIEVSQEEMAQALAMICEQNNITMEKIEEQYNDEFHDNVKRSVLTGKVMAWLREHAEITVVEK